MGKMGTEKQEPAQHQILYSLAVVGPGAVGKSSITLQFIQQSFTDEYDPTIEDQHRKQTVVDDECAMLDILDTAGQEEYIAMREQYLLASEGFLLVFALNTRKSFEQMKDLYTQIERIRDSEKFPVVLAGNKSDLPEEFEVSAEEVKEFIKSKPNNTIKYYECSAKLGKNIEECFFQLVREVRAFRNPTKAKKKNSFCSLL